MNRLLPIVDADHILILTNAALVEAIAAALPEIPRDNIIAEPRPAGTAAALTWAAVEIERRDKSDPTMLSIHADWAIGDEQGFRDVLVRAEKVAVREHALVTVGVVPDRTETGYGYIQPASGDAASGVAVARFVEKPDRNTAETFVASGYLWNSGIFVWRTADFLGEVSALTPEISGALDGAATSGLDKFFSSVRSVSVDTGVLERSRKVMTVAADFGWDDIGTWPALLRSRDLDSAGNSASGPVHLVDARDNVVHADKGSVVLYGVSDLVVVARDGVTLVTTTEKAADLKALVDRLPKELREPK